MSKMVAQFIDSDMVEEQIELNEGKEEATTADEAPSIGNAVNIFNYVLTAQKSIFDKQPLSNGLAQKSTDNKSIGHCKC